MAKEKNHPCMHIAQTLPGQLAVVLCSIHWLLIHYTQVLELLNLHLHLSRCSV